MVRSSDPKRQHFFPLPYFLGRNGILFARKHAGAIDWLRYACWSNAAMLARWVRALATRLLPFVGDRDREGHRYWDWEVSYARGVLDGWRGRSPEIALRDADAGATRRGGG